VRGSAQDPWPRLRLRQTSGERAGIGTGIVRAGIGTGNSGLDSDYGRHQVRERERAGIGPGIVTGTPTMADIR
jgi:hypothetical protein